MVVLLVLLAAAGNAPQSGLAAQPTPARSIFIQSPREGQPLQGVEIIEGRIRGEGFLSGKISFAHQQAEDPSWFFIADLAPDTAEGDVTAFVVEWDTSQITDGDYRLRVKANFEGRVAVSEEVRGLRIRNYSLIETSTPAPPQPGQEVPRKTEPVELTLQDTPPPTAKNPAALDQSDMVEALMLGLGAAGGLFLLGAIYTAVKKVTG